MSFDLHYGTFFIVSTFIGCIQYNISCVITNYIDYPVGLVVKCIFQLTPMQHCGFSCLSLQADDAEQNKTGAGRLRGREPRKTAEDVLTQVGVYIHASGSPEQSRQEEGQVGTQGSRQSREGFLGRSPTNGKYIHSSNLSRLPIAGYWELN